MKILYLIVSGMVIMSFVWLTLLMRKNVNKYFRVVCGTAFVAIVSIVVYDIFMLTKSIWIARLTYGIYLSDINWLVVLMFIYVFKYTDNDDYLRIFRIPIVVISLILNIALVLEAHNKYIFSLTYLDDKYGVWMVELKFGANIYYIYSYFFALVTMILLTIYVVKESYVYKMKYLGVLIPYCVVTGVSIANLFIGFRIDISIFCYVFCAVFIYYFSNYAVPDVVVNKSLLDLNNIIDDAIICFDGMGEFVYKNKRADILFGKKNELNTIDDYFTFLSANSVGTDAVSPDWEKEGIECILKCGNIQRHYSVESASVYKDSVKTASYIKLRDHTEEMRRLQREHYQVTHDSLTGIYNRVGFFEKVSFVLEEDYDSKWIMVCSNIKDFKLLNKFFGEATGDNILVKQAEIMQTSTSGKSVFGRIGDDKFAIFIKKEDFNIEVFYNKINEMQDLVEGSIYKMHYHVGIYEVENNDESPQAMYDKAKIAMDSIKDGYRQIFSTYDSNMMDKVLAEKNVVSEFEDALEKRQFEMFLQPQNSTNGNVIGAEALVRWNHPMKGLMNPGFFVPVLENAGSIYKLDLYMWETAAKKLREWKELGRDDLYISVNLSPKDFYYMDIYKELTDLVEKYEISPRNLKIEITESVLFNEFHNIRDLLKQLQKYGFFIEIDDFGSGYSSLNMLKDVKADVLKIDMQFLRNNYNVERNRIILDSIITMSKQLNMEVVTEGVETSQQKEMLAALGADIFQGYYFAKPMEVEEFEKMYM